MDNLNNPSYNLNNLSYNLNPSYSLNPMCNLNLLCSLKHLMDHSLFLNMETIPNSQATIHTDSHIKALMVHLILNLLTYSHKDFRNKVPILNTLIPCTLQQPPWPSASQRNQI